MTNKKPKVIKDWNGNSWLTIIVDSPSVDYNASYGMGITTVTSSWTEIGAPNNRDDLYNNGMIPSEY